MNSKEALSDLFFLAIGDEKHTKKCKETIEKDLERLEKLEDVIAVIKYIKEILKKYLIMELREPIGNSGSIYFSIINHNKAIVNISKEEYELLKEWLEND